MSARGRGEWRLALGLAAAVCPGAASAGEIPRALVVLESEARTLPDHVPAAAPPRFVLMEDGQVFVGGTRDIASVRLEGRELKDLERRIQDVRKMPALAGVVTIGPGTERRRLLLRKGGRALDMRVEGALAQAPVGLQPLASFIASLESFHHRGLRPWSSPSLALAVREGELPGGCRKWTRPEPIAEAIFAPRVVPASDFPSWPRGAVPASVCAADKKYVVTLRPLLPDERP